MSDMHDTTKAIIHTQEELERLCEYWKRRIGLADWEFAIRIKRAEDMISESQGDCHWKLAIRQAVIQIIDPVDYSKHNMGEQDMERSLVHEMLHPLFGPVDKEENSRLEDIMLEQAIESIAKALVKFRRGQQELLP